MNILLHKNIKDYYSSPINQIYFDISAVAKEYYEPGEQFLFDSYGFSDTYFWKYLFRIFVNLDIPFFFLNIKINSLDTKQIVLDAKNQIAPWEEDPHFDVNLSIDFEEYSTLTNFDIPETICINPYVNVEVRWDSTYRPCCEYRNTLTDKNNNSYTIQTHDIEQYWNSDALAEVRQKFLKGEKPNECLKCWRSEAGGNERSKRVRDEYVYREKYFSIDWNNIHQQNILSLDLKLGNNCNLACRICRPELSSSIYHEIKKHIEMFDKDPIPGKSEWISETDSYFWTKFRELVKYVNHMEFTGGEPLLDKKHHKILQQFIDVGVANNVTIHYNTNGTVFPQEKLFSLYDKFKSVGFSFSLDDIEQRFDYHRYGSKWSKVLENLEEYKKLSKDKFVINIYAVVSVFNIYNLDKLIAFAQNNDLNIETGLVDRPSEFCIDNIPLEHRHEIIEKLESVDNEYFQQKAKFYINRLKKNIYADCNNDFWKNINRIDSIRNQSFSVLYPEMSRIMTL